MSWLTDIITSIFASRFAAFAFMLTAVTFAIFVRYGGGQPLASVDASFVPFHEAPELVAQNDIPLSRVVVGTTGTIYGVVHPRFQRPRPKVGKRQRDWAVFALSKRRLATSRSNQADGSDDRWPRVPLGD